MRSTYTDWAKGSIIAVDAGAHLASIIRILEEELPSSSEEAAPKGYETILKKGPFAGLPLPNISAKANGLYIYRELIHSFLITHPHLDHISGLGINTPALEYGRETKDIVALPTTIEAIKQHIFNDLIWPNLSDEEGGVGFVSYRRLMEGGNPRLGSGDGRGYVSVCSGLQSKCLTVSHGRCKRRGSISHGHASSMGFSSDPFTFPQRRVSRTSEDKATYLASIATQQNDSQGRVASAPVLTNLPQDRDPNFMAVESSAFFIRNETDGSEIIVFGDIEPDSVSLNPRNHIVWEDAASRIVSGNLKAIFIECSYDDSVRDQDLYGHLCPRHLITELRFLGSKVTAMKGTGQQTEPSSPTTIAGAGASTASMSSSNSSSSPNATRKRKRPAKSSVDETTANGGSSPQQSEYVGRSVPHVSTMAPPQPPPTNLQSSLSNATSTLTLAGQPLSGLQVHIIHVKDTLVDGPAPRDIILKQLREQGEAAGLGCDFFGTERGGSIWI